MILGTGIDLVSISRFREMPRKEQLATRILTDAEFDEYAVTDDQGLYLARAWAIKESVSKSFGTGIAGKVMWKNMQLKYTELGQPRIQFNKELHRDGIQCHVSVSHDGDRLVANAILSLLVN